MVVPIGPGTSLVIGQGVTLSSELAGCVQHFGWDWDDLRLVTMNAAKSLFLSYDERSVVMRPIREFYAEVLGSGGAGARSLIAR